MSNPLTNQQIFDTVLTGLRAQGRASFYRTKATELQTICLYRGKDDAGNVTKCAAGLLIDDADYRESFENMPADMVYAEGGFADKVSRKGNSLALLTDLQLAHDERLARGSFEQWETKMGTVAERFGLAYSAPATATA